MIDNRDKVNTGDLLLFSGNTTTAFLVKFFSSSDYNHVGVAIRLDRKNNITTKKNGKLYVLEINAIERYDVLRKKYVKGLALTDYNELIKNYNDIKVRHVDRTKLGKHFISKTRLFIEKNKDIKYNSTLGPIIGVWIGCPITGIEREKDEMFCSEMIALFYLEVCGILPTIEKPAKLYKPDDLIFPNQGIFTGKEYSVFTDYSHSAVVMLIPLIAGLFFITMISMILPRKTRSNI